MNFRILAGVVEIAAALLLGRVSGSALGAKLTGIVSINRPGVRATVRLVRFTIAYLAVAMMTWTVALSNLRFVHQAALIILAALIGGGALAGRPPGKTTP